MEKINYLYDISIGIATSYLLWIIMFGIFIVVNIYWGII